MQDSNTQERTSQTSLDQKLAEAAHMELQLLELRQEIEQLEFEGAHPVELKSGEDLTRFSFQALTKKAAIKGYLIGLAAEGFPMETLPQGFTAQLEQGEGLPRNVEKVLADWTMQKQARAAFPILEEVHRWRALRAVQIGNSPLGILRGREYLALPLLLAGRFHAKQLTKELHPLLVRFCLDKDGVQDRIDPGAVVHPEIEKLFLAKRHELFVQYGLGNYDAFARFVSGKSALIGWPEELIRPFATDVEILLDGIGQFATHF